MSDLSGEYAFDTLLDRFEVSAVTITQKNTEIQQLRDQVRELQKTNKELLEQIKTASESVEQLQAKVREQIKEAVCAPVGEHIFVTPTALVASVDYDIPF